MDDRTLVSGQWQSGCGKTKVCSTNQCSCERGDVQPVAAKLVADVEKNEQLLVLVVRKSDIDDLEEPSKFGLRNVTVVVGVDLSMACNVSARDTVNVRRKLQGFALVV